MRGLIAIPALILFSACENQSYEQASGYDAVSTEVAQDSSQSQNYAGRNAEGPTTETDSAYQQYMAYRYNYGYVLPAKAVAATANSHMQICLDAGPAKCEVLNSTTQSRNESYVSASLIIRGEPKWLESYKTQISESVSDAKGELKNLSIDAEDLTRAILDTDARLKAKKSLRTRLETHLETRNAELADLLALERELARVQGEIESITSNLNVLKKRVSKSIVNLNYQSKSVAVDGGTFSPVTEAFKSFFENFAWALGAVITFFAAFLPWLILVILPLIWVVRWIWRRSRREKKTKAPRPKKAAS